MKIVCLFAFAAVLPCLSGIAKDPAPELKIRPDHPRMFFNRDTWPAIKERALKAGTPENGALVKLLAVVDRYPANPVCRNTGPVTTPPSQPIPETVEWGQAAAECALAWRFTGDVAYLEKTKRMLKSSVAAYREAYRNRRAVHWFSTRRILALCAYDWVYEALSDDERRELITSLVEHVEEIQAGEGRPPITRRNNGGIQTGFYGVRSLLWYSGLAAAGDGYCDGLANAHLKLGYDLCLQLMEYRNSIAGDDGGLSSGVPDYSMGAYPWAHFNFMHTFLSATGRNIAGHYPGMGLFPNWIWWNWIPDADGKGPRCFGFGDDQHEQNLLDVSRLYEHMTQYAFFFADADRDSARLAATLREMAPNRNLGKEWPMYPFILPSKCDVRPFQEEELASVGLRARHFSTLGQFVMRSGWKSDSTYCLYTAGADTRTFGHKHWDENNFVIYKRDFLVLDTGSRGAETDTNLRYYYAQTVAHNCVLVHKPGEEMPYHWGKTSDEPEGKINHGGQYSGSAKVLAFRTGDAFSYVASDATAAYGKKCTEAVRQFVHLADDVFIVYDRMGASDPSYRKEWLLHSQNEPRVEGSLAIADCGEGRICCRTLLPAGASIAKVGGPGREFWASGKNWELDPRFLSNAKKRAKEYGIGPYFGNWRIEVSPSVPAADDRFLHVLNATVSSGGKPVECRYERTDAEDVAVIAIPDCEADGMRGALTARIGFNRTGEVRATIRYWLHDPDGRKLLERSFVLGPDVMPQKGVFCGKVPVEEECKIRPSCFKPIEIPGLEPKPDFWKVRTEEIMDICSRAKKCARKEIICRTPLGYPVYALFYGDSFNDKPPQTNWSAGSSSTTYRSYMGDTPPGKQTFLLLTGVHGAEPECVAGAMNIIQALETGRDFRGRAHPELLELVSKYRFIVVPCLNMDGRSISPDHLRGIEWTKFREVSQGVWKDGSRIGWRGSKSWFPLPLDKVSFPGGYPNSEGYNIMHDACPGDMRTEEARAILKLASRWRVDAVLNGHSYESAPSIVRHSSVDTPANEVRCSEIAARINAAIHAAGLRKDLIPQLDGVPRINLNTMIAMASGALALTLECSVSYDRADRPELKPPRRKYSFDELMEPLFISLGEYLKAGLEKPFLVRGSEKVYSD